jgi:glycosyltransferase involved in cell wall biosynthesis
MKPANKPLVSICCITYNHEKYIAEAIEGFLLQKTTFPIEIIIHDDASTDNTPKIIRSYTKKHPNLIKTIYQKENQYKLGKKIFPFVLKKAEGKYFALCEGDDYWSDPLKLQKQVDFLENNIDFTICSHNVIVRDETQKKISEHEWLGKNHRKISEIHDLLRFGSNGATCSLVFKKNNFQFYHSIANQINGGDWLLQISCVLRGKMRYFPEIMGVYRRHNNGSLIAAIKNEIKVGNKDVIGLPQKYGIRAVDIIDKNLNYKYHKELSEHKLGLIIDLARSYSTVDWFISMRHITSAFVLATQVKHISRTQIMALLFCINPLPKFKTYLLYRIKTIRNLQ